MKPEIAPYQRFLERVKGIVAWTYLTDMDLSESFEYVHRAVRNELMDWIVYYEMTSEQVKELRLNILNEVIESRFRVIDKKAEAKANYILNK